MDLNIYLKVASIFKTGSTLRFEFTSFISSFIFCGRVALEIIYLS